MRRFRLKVTCVGLVLTLGCGESGTGPDPGGEGARLAVQFEQLADSVDDAGYSPTAEALRHAAEIVRLAGGATAVTLSIDGASRSFLAVAEQIDYPIYVCSSPADSGVVVPGDSGVVGPPPAPAPEPGTDECTVTETAPMRTLIAWEPERMAEVVRIVADAGAGSVQPTVPDVMAGQPDSVVSGGGWGGYPGFMGEYLVRDFGSWWAVEGRQSNALEDQGGSCTRDAATFAWAEFTCSAARFRFEFSMRVEPLRYEPLMQREPGVGSAWAGAEGSHRIELASSTVSGVRLALSLTAPAPDSGRASPASP